MSKVISILSKKGGSGKTTTSLNLAADLVLRGYSVVVVDADMNNDSSSMWCEANGGKYFPVIGTTDRALGSIVKSLRGAFDFIVIDGSANASVAIGDAIKCSDMVAIVCGTSLLDVVRNMAVATLVYEIDANLNTQTPCKWLLTRCIKNSNVVDKTIEKIGESRIPKIFGAATSELIAYKEAFWLAATIFDAPDHLSSIKGAREQTKAITDELLEVLS